MQDASKNFFSFFNFVTGVFCYYHSKMAIIARLVDWMQESTYAEVKSQMNKSASLGIEILMTGQAPVNLSILFNQSSTDTPYNSRHFNFDRLL